MHKHLVEAITTGPWRMRLDCEGRNIIFDGDTQHTPATTFGGVEREKHGQQELTRHC
jgi:hypothetical protein